MTKTSKTTAIKIDGVIYASRKVAKETLEKNFKASLPRPTKAFKVGDTASAKKLGRDGVEVVTPIKGRIERQSGRFSYIRLGPNKSALVLTKNLY